MTRLIILFIALLFSSVAFAIDSKYEALDLADLFFKKMQQQRYTYVWENLSEKSRKTILSDVADAVKDFSGETYEEVKSDFNSCDEICKSFWKGYLTVFDPKDILENTEWSFGEVSKKYIKINLKHKDSDRPAFLKLYKESGKWKVGLTESFWLRKRLQ